MAHISKTASLIPTKYAHSALKVYHRKNGSIPYGMTVCGSILKALFVYVANQMQNSSSHMNLSEGLNPDEKNLQCATERFYLFMV